MKLLLLAACCLGTQAIVSEVTFSFARGQHRTQFEQWMRTHAREYQTREEYEYRFQVWVQNLQSIDEFNDSRQSYSKTMNRFGDLTPKEFQHHYITGVNKERLLTSRASRSHLPTFSHEMVSDPLPKKVDWRQKGAVTAVKNQQSCGSCWAFSTTGATEGAWFLSTGNLTSLSEQQLVDCGGSTGNQGCNGGLMDAGFQWIIDNKGVTGEDIYPYEATDGECRSSDKPVLATLSSFQDVKTTEASLTAAIATHGPVSVAIEADQMGFQFYDKGVFKGDCGVALDHGVLAVGYGTDSDDGDYYIVKNSWGAQWGEDGYIRLARDDKGETYNDGQGQCGIALSPSYPIV